MGSRSRLKHMGLGALQMSPHMPATRKRALFHVINRIHRRDSIYEQKKPAGESCGQRNQKIHRKMTRSGNKRERWSRYGLNFKVNRIYVNFVVTMC